MFYFWVLRPPSFCGHGTLNFKVAFDQCYKKKKMWKIVLPFFHSKKYQEYAKITKASYCLTTNSLKDFLPNTCKPLIVENVLYISCNMQGYIRCCRSPKSNLRMLGCGGEAWSGCSTCSMLLPGPPQEWHPLQCATRTPLPVGIALLRQLALAEGYGDILVHVGGKRSSRNEYS